MKNSLTIVLSGEAGQGLQTIEGFLVEAIAKSYYVFSTKEVMSRVRGGNNTLEIRVSDESVYAYQHTIDMLFLLNDHSFSRLTKRITEKTIIFGEEGFADQSVIEEKKATFQPFNLGELSKQAGGALFANTLLFGFVSGMLNLDEDSCKNQIMNRFERRGEKLVSDNKAAFDMGYTRGREYPIQKNINKSTKTSTYKMSDGTTAVGIGAIAGGCNFVAAYPMSPGTGVLTYLARKSNAFEILVEQAEDEIAALNMVIGAWYAGARGLTTTSGGGFALMEEAVSLSGINETPCVIHVAQRPGPGTGLPTRTEQADLNLVVYAGHGEFPRIVFAPGKLEDAVQLTQKAFYLADKYQVPVFILTDQFFLESLGQMEYIELDEKYLESFITKTDVDYKRYLLTQEGLSPRGIPGYGDGLVKVDSDEHDEAGGITEDFDVRILMNDKRLKKRELLLEEYSDAELIGPSDYKNLVVGWGSTYGVLSEFVETSGTSDTAFLYIKQVFPIHEYLKAYFNKAKKVIVVENNATGQFANLLKLELDVKIDHKILKYNGEPFSIEEVEKRLKEVLL
ncbi:MAG: 2-oxoacid:acceptor oxidoreductase subunit alpha [Firmicutes bacterium HGW-Firmicutes-1]|jgi:2-oxoglutarate ferredoxin oxidoreductase subunit alpha|nr:MAG: 2-oxoacid:acceptor oxidoreductase subunit alpha [Firmicutes bacterium HGW-Firmicutes-1]